MLNGEWNLQTATPRLQSRQSRLAPNHYVRLPLDLHRRLCLPAVEGKYHARGL
jgi:hypothetical protein